MWKLDFSLCENKGADQFRINALVICNTAPQGRGRAGDSRGNERGFDQSFTMAVWGKYPGFSLYMQKGPLEGTCWTKSQSPRYSPGLGGGGAVGTND